MDPDDETPLVVASVGRSGAGAGVDLDAGDEGVAPTTRVGSVADRLDPVPDDVDVVVAAPDAVAAAVAATDGRSGVPVVGVGDSEGAERVLRDGADAFVPRGAPALLADRVRAVADRARAAAEGRGDVDDGAATDVPAHEVPAEGSPAAVLERIDDAFFALDDEWRFVYLNGRAEELLGVDARRLIGRNVWDEFPQAIEDAFYDRYSRAMREQAAVSFEEYYAPLDAWFEVNAYPSQAGLSVYFRDVTDRRERAHARRELVEVSRALLTAESRAEIATLVADAAGEALGFDGTGVRTVEEATGRLVPVALGASVDGASEADRPAVPVDGTPHGRAVETGDTVRETIADDDPYGRDPFVETMYVPIGDHGVLSVGAVDGGFDEADVEHAELLAACAAAAFDRFDREAEIRVQSTVLETVGEKVFALDADGRVRLLTDDLAEFLGVDPDAAVGSRIVDLLDDPALADGRQELDALRESIAVDAPDGDGGAASRAFETRVTVDGIPTPIEVELWPYPGDGAPAPDAGGARAATDGGVIGIVHDVSALHTARERLDREQSRFRDLFENLPDPAAEVEVVDDRPIVRDANPAFAETFGLDPDAVEGEPIDDYIVPPDEEASSRRLVRAAGSDDPTVAEVSREAADGIRQFLYRGVSHQGRDGRGFAIYTDVTDRTRRRRQLQVLNRVLRHNLRNRLNLVLGYADRLRRGVDEPKLVDAAERLTATAQGLVDLGDDARRIESSLGGRDAGAGPVDAAGIGRELCRTFSDLDRVEAVSCDLPDSLPVEAGPGLADALERLVRNAVEHAGERPTIRISASPAGDADRWVDVRVRDDGPGIPETEREVIAGDREPTQLAHGTGLGLWLVRWTVEAYGGEIRFEGDDDGTTVVVRLRRAAPDALDGAGGRDGADAGGESDDPGDDPATRDAGRERVD